jgi:hypothetical protein
MELGHPKCVVGLRLVDGGVDVTVDQTQRRVQQAASRSRSTSIS